jgi:hypothetical protein
MVGITQSHHAGLGWPRDVLGNYKRDNHDDEYLADCHQIKSGGVAIKVSGKLDSSTAKPWF